MTWTAIAAYLAAHGLELAGFVTASSASGSPRKRLLICWPVVSSLSFFTWWSSTARTLLRRAAAGLLRRLHVLRLVALVARRAQEGEVRVVPLRAKPACSLSPGMAAACAGNAGQAPSRRAALSRRRADELQPRRQLVAGAQAHRQLVALDSRRCVYIGEYIYKDLWPRRCSMRASWVSPCSACATGVARQRTLNSPPAPHSCSGSPFIYRRNSSATCAARAAQTAVSIRRYAA
jgi:hypothetical protein